MALAPYFHRGALAAAQVLEGFDESRFQATLEATPVGIAVAEDATCSEANALADLLVRLLARLYPRLAIMGPANSVDSLRQLAAQVNPAIELESDATVGVSIGTLNSPFPTTFYAGSAGWHALVGQRSPLPIGKSDNPFGPGAAACIAAANVFRCVFLPQWQAESDEDVCFCMWSMDTRCESEHADTTPWHLADEPVLIGIGAIGNATLWALARAPAEATIHLVDHEPVELSNVQRYALTTPDDVGRWKVDLAAGIAGPGIDLVPHRETLAEYVGEHGYVWDRFLLALDTASARRSAQAVLPYWIANAWTQPGDLGVSVHPYFGGEGACVACLYLPKEQAQNEDELVAQSLRVPHLQGLVRTLLFTGAPVGRDLLEAVAGAVEKPLDLLLPFEGRPIRDLYVEGFCGGAVIALGEAGRPPQDLHVPLAHQSALAGVMLGASLIRSSEGGDPPITSATRVNVLRKLGRDLTVPIRAERDGRCLCDDALYVERYRSKYARAAPPG